MLAITEDPIFKIDDEADLKSEHCRTFRWTFMTFAEALLNISRRRSYILETIIKETRLDENF